MPKLQLLKEPGFVYDVLSLFSLRFNKQKFLSSLPHANAQQREELAEYYEGLYKQVGHISDDLFVFFYALENGKNVISTLYFSTCTDHFASDYDFRYLQNSLLNKEELLRNVIRFYLLDLSEKEIEECAGSLVNLFAYIKESKLPDEIKKRLYEFFVDPDPYIRALLCELMDVAKWVEDHYKSNYELILAGYNDITFEKLADQLAVVKDLRTIDFGEDPIYVSYCLLHKYFVYYCQAAKGIICLIGRKYEDVLSAQTKENGAFNLESLGGALCENSRVRILELLLEQGELTCKDLEKAFEFSGSTAYHHVSLLVRAGAVKTRNVGKTVYYDINPDYFGFVITELMKFSDRDKRRARK
ncbi:MAG: helix-turn-helix transcriptional regulator [Clostridia bacterium]|nr:helix-turn-helix transcriptional regulator [Clostridia bacterium]